MKLQLNFHQVLKVSSEENVLVLLTQGLMYMSQQNLHFRIQHISTFLLPFTMVFEAVNGCCHFQFKWPSELMVLAKGLTIFNLFQNSKPLFFSVIVLIHSYFHACNLFFSACLMSSLRCYIAGAVVSAKISKKIK